jgi:hypothetical protein
MSDFVQIARDPFARHDVIRRQEQPGQLQRCAWCGNRNHNDKLYRYGVWEDGGRVRFQRELFCSVGCMRSYHNID